MTDPLFDAENEAGALQRRAETAEEIARDAIEARDIGRAALMLMKAEQVELRSRVAELEAALEMALSKATPPVEEGAHACACGHSCGYWTMEKVSPTPPSEAHATCPDCSGSGTATK